MPPPTVRACNAVCGGTGCDSEQPLRRGRDARRRGRRPAAAERERPQGKHDASWRRGHDEAETRAVVEAYKEILDRIAAERLQVNVALKLTHLGLAFDEELARANIGELVTHAAGSATSSGSTWRSRRSSTRPCRCSARCARRAISTSAPSSSPTSTAPRPTSRRCLTWSRTSASSRARTSSPTEVAYPAKSDVDSAYARLIERSLMAGGFTAIATHDQALIAHAIVRRGQRHPAPRFQFQMLYGVRSKLQVDLAQQGYDVSSRRPTAPTGTAT